MCGAGFFAFGDNMKVKKTINNNIVCVIDKKGSEMIVTGLGIGFKKKIGELIDESKIDKIYRMEDKGQQRRLRELVAQIPIEDLELTSRLIEDIKLQIHQPLNESLLITLADHISFALKRKREGIEFSNPLAGEIMTYYPTEYHLGQQCLRVISETYGTELHPDEAAFIALHIVNAELNTNMSQMHKITELIHGCIEVTERYYNKRFDRESLDFQRFTVHLRYFVKRILSDMALKDTEDESDASFRKMIAMTCRKHYGCAEKIGEYIKEVLDIDLTEEEKVYLTIHLKRINMAD